MQNFFIKRFLSWLAGNLDGYKTIIGGLGLVATGLVGFAGQMFPGQGLPEMGIDDSLAALSAGFVALGIGGKLEKARCADIQKNMGS